MRFDIEVPEWAIWMTQDQDGTWSIHSKKPELDSGGEWIATGRREYIAFQSGVKIENWRDELYEIYWE